MKIYIDKIRPINNFYYEKLNLKLKKNYNCLNSHFCLYNCKHKVI